MCSCVDRIADLERELSNLESRVEDMERTLYGTASFGGHRMGGGLEDRVAELERER